MIESRLRVDLHSPSIPALDKIYQTPPRDPHRRHRTGVRVVWSHREENIVIRLIRLWRRLLLRESSGMAVAGTHPPLPWAVEKRAVLGNFEVDDLAFSVCATVLLRRPLGPIPPGPPF